MSGVEMKNNYLRDMR